MTTYPSIERLNESAKERGKPFRVLIVDDEKHNREVFQEFCELTSAIEVELAESGQEALEKVQNEQFDLVAVDLIMPDISGLEVVSGIKQNSPHLPVVVITGNATDRIITQAGLLGACRVIHKPVELETFLSELALTLLR